MKRQAGRWLAFAAAGLLAAAAWPSAELGRAAEPFRPKLREPVYRVSRAKVDGAPRDGAHPLDAVLDMAEEALERFRQDVRDYTATVIKRERLGETLNDYEYMFLKVRTRQFENGRMVSPLHVYMYFLKPDSIKGREVIWVEGRNDNKLVAHEGGAKGRFLPTVWLAPDSALAMRNQRYPITEIGLENLIYRLIERGEYERQFDDVQVRFIKGAKLNGRPCTVLEIEHPVKRDYYEFNKAHIFIDDELQLPVRYAAYDWPETPGGKLQVIEEYTYVNIKLNVGLSDADFDPENPKYGF